MSWRYSGAEDFTEDAFHGIIDFEVRLGSIGHVDKHQVEGGIQGVGEIILAVQAVCLADAAPHQDAVNGVAQTFFRNGDDKLDGIAARPVKVFPPYSPQRIGQDSLDIALGEQPVYGCAGAESGRLGQPVIVHGWGAGGWGL